MLFEMTVWVIFTGVVAAVWFTAGMAYADNHPAVVEEPRVVFPRQPDPLRRGDDLLVFNSQTWPLELHTGERAHLMPALPPGVTLEHMTKWIRAFIETEGWINFTVRGIRRMPYPPAWAREQETITEAKKWLVHRGWLDVDGRGEAKPTEDGWRIFKGIHSGVWNLEEAILATEES